MRATEMSRISTAVLLISMKFNLTLFYLYIVEIRGGQMLNGNGIDIFQRIMFVIKHVHSNHFADYILPMELQYIFRRRLAVAMSGRPRLNLLA